VLQEAEFIRKSLRYLNRYFEKCIEQSVVQTGFTIPQMRVIQEVVSHQGISIKQLSHNLQMTQSTVSGIVDRLVHKGILMKKPNDRDRRSVQIYYTSNVARFLEHDRMEYVNRPVVDVLSRLSPEERAIVMEGIRLLVAAVGQHTDRNERTIPE
jgi:DNA-binding MarR family transcriptional regulator